MVLAHNFEDGTRTEDITISEDVSFNTMLLNTNTLVGLLNSGFYKPSPIQLHGIPLGKCGFDLLLEAKSGTGKTVVFSVIALEKVNLEKGIQSIVLAPTREIAFQICDVIQQIGVNYKGLRVEAFIGGMPVQDDLEKLKHNVHIIVGSPGRLRHLIQDKHIDVSSIRLVVLDEADKLMEKSFIADVNYIMSVLPKQKQVIMSSATYPDETKTFINKYVKNVQLVCPDSNNVLLGIEQKVTIVNYHSNILKQTKNRYDELKKILSQKQFKQCLIFCNYQARVGDLYKMLTKDKWPVDQLYGKQEQTQRLDALKTLKEYKCRILVSTDLAARGIDASNIDIVINFEPPFEWQTYLHRIGRAGRYGSHGTAISILTKGKEEENFKNMLEKMRLPINLTYLWSGEPFNEQDSVTNFETLLHIDIPKEEKINDKSDTFWHVLTENAEKNEVLSFEGLCNSFDKSAQQNNIESFTDLMNSFAADKHNDGDVSYKHLKIQTITLPKVETNNLLSKFLSNNVKENNIKNSCVKDEQLKYESNMQFCKVAHREESNTETDHNIDFREESNCYKQSLIDAGLPTEFLSSKQNKDNNSKKKTNYNKNKDVYGPWEPAVTDKSYETYSCDEINTYKNTSCIESVKRHKNKVIASMSNIGKNMLHQRHKRVESYSSTQDSRGHMFDVWYSQLKAQMQYIEYSLYLHEMSRL